MLINALLPLHRLQPLESNSKKHKTSSTSASIDKYGFRDPIQVDLVLLELKYQALTWDEIIADNTIMLPLVVGHDRRNALLAAFKQDSRRPPKNCQLVKSSLGDEWLVPGTVARSKDMAEALAYSIDHNLTTIAALDDEQMQLLLFDSAKLAEQADILAGIDPGFVLAGLDVTMADLSLRLDSNGSDDDDEDDDDNGSDDYGDDDYSEADQLDPESLDNDSLDSLEHECPQCGHRF